MAEEEEINDRRSQVDKRNYNVEEILRRVVQASDGRSRSSDDGVL